MSQRTLVFFLLPALLNVSLIVSEILALNEPSLPAFFLFFFFFFVGSFMDITPVTCV